MTQDMKETWLTTSEAAALLKVHPKTLRVYVSKGLISVSRPGGTRRLLFDASELQTFLKKGRRSHQVHRLNMEDSVYAAPSGLDEREHDSSPGELIEDTVASFNLPHHRREKVWAILLRMAEAVCEEEKHEMEAKRGP